MGKPIPRDDVMADQRDADPADVLRLFGFDPERVTFAFGRRLPARVSYRFVSGDALVMRDPSTGDEYRIGLTFSLV